MKKLLVLLALVLVVAGCTPGDGSGNRTYYVDCGNAADIGSGSCGLTVTSVGWGQ